MPVQQLGGKSQLTQVSEMAMLMTSDMAAEEAKLHHLREAEEKVTENEMKKNVKANDSVLFNTKLQKLLEKAKAYSEFLFKNMNSDLELASESILEGSDDDKPKRGRKRKGSEKKSHPKASKKASAPQHGASSRAAVEAAEIAAANEAVGLTEEERCLQEQKRLCPNLTGGVLKDYQLKGIKWLISLWQNGLNGILADQMGLGKTVQTIGLLAHLIHQGMVGPFLIVAPLSTVSNWINEITKWMPGTPVLLYHGSKEARAALREKKMPYAVKEGFPIIVTSFEVAMFDRRFLQRYHFKYLVVDEGHRLKNFECRLIKELRLLQSDNSLLLTGTPLQNNLKELWSLLNFILPSVFTSASEFTSWFDLQHSESVEEGEDQEATAKEKRAQVLGMLHQILRPFLLRRLKEDVERNIPPKKEIILYVKMTDHQKHFNDHLISKTLEDYLHKTSEAPIMSRGRLNNVLMQLRKNCNHPDILASHYEVSALYPPVDELVSQCGKLQLLDRLIPKLKARGHKVLVFSQMTRLLDILDYYFEERGYHTFRIDGSVKQEDRRDQIKDFQEKSDDFVIFLLSTRAGGLGINLTAADTVIVYDSDWNPHMDMQAMDRCHRIGQTKPVHVYRLITAHSVEGKMLETATSKLKLEHLVIEKGEFFKPEKDPNAAKSTKIEESEIIDLLQPSQSDEQAFVQSKEISDEDMDLLLDRSELVTGSQNGKIKSKLPEKGPGWEVVVSSGGRGALASIT